MLLAALISSIQSISNDVFYATVSQSILMTSIPLIGAYIYLKNKEPGLWHKTLSPDLPAITHFMSGGVFFILAATVGVLIIQGLGLYEFHRMNVKSIININTLGLLAYLFFQEALPEEFIFRGLIQSRLRQYFSFLKSILLQASLFTLTGSFTLLILSLFKSILLPWLPGLEYVQTLTLAYPFYLFIFGLTLGVARALFNSIWVSMGIHCLYLFTVRSIGEGPNVLIEVTFRDQAVPLAAILLTAFFIPMTLLGFLGLVLCVKTIAR